MNSPDAVEVALRIPGNWSSPEDLLQRIPEGHRLEGHTLYLPDGTEIEIGAGKADNQFAGVFRSACRRPPSKEEMAAVERYTVNVFVSGPGGSLPAALSMMQAAAAILHAGGAGVFIDNSALAHGAQDWLDMTEDGSPDALSFAFVGIVRGRTEVTTMGMHVLGLRDLVMKRADADADEFSIIEVIRYLARGEHPIDNGHILADLKGPRYQAFTQDATSERAGSQMHNPFGKLKLVSVKDIAETN